MQLVNHAFNAIRMLIHIFDEQNPALHRRHVPRADQRRKNRQIATPQHAGNIDGLGLRRVARHLERRVRDRVPEMLHRERARFFRTEISSEHRIAKGLHAGQRVQRQLDCGEVAMADNRDRLILQAALQALVVQAMKNACSAITAAHRQYDVRQRTRRIGKPVQVRGAFAVSAAEALKTTVRHRHILQPMPLRAQALHRASDYFRVGVTRRCDEIDGTGRVGHERMASGSMESGGTALRASRASRTARRRSAKKLRSALAHSSPSTPPVTLVWWFRWPMANASTTLPHAPVFGSCAPNTTRAILACMIAPAHMMQGSSVT